MIIGEGVWSHGTLKLLFNFPPFYNLLLQNYICLSYSDIDKFFYFLFFIFYFLFF